MPDRGAGRGTAVFPGRPGLGGGDLLRRAGGLSGARPARRYPGGAASAGGASHDPQITPAHPAFLPLVPVPAAVAARSAVQGPGLRLHRIPVEAVVAGLRRSCPRRAGQADAGGTRRPGSDAGLLPRNDEPQPGPIPRSRPCAARLGDAITMPTRVLCGSRDMRREMLAQAAGSVRRSRTNGTSSRAPGISCTAKPAEVGASILECCRRPGSMRRGRTWHGRTTAGTGPTVVLPPGRGASCVSASVSAGMTGKLRA